MTSLRMIAAAALLAGASVLVTTDSSAQGQRTSFRVCADPNNLPYSNERREGFENKIVDLIAQEFGATPTFTWWPDRRGFIRNTLRANQCDVVMGVPNGYDQVRWTQPYYRSTYAFVFAREGSFHVRSWDDAALRRARIGVVAATPPADAMIKKGLMGNVVSYRLTIDYTKEYPGQIVDDVANGKTDVAIVWGPVAGYFAKKQSVPLEVVPVPALEGIDSPLTYEISMGVRRGDRERQGQLDDVITRKQAEIRRILEEYGVPLVPGALVRKPDEVKQGVVSERYQ